MNKKIVKALYRKEILDILRDKKTILMMIVVPLILYPLIFMFSMYLSSTMLTASTSKSYRVSVQDTENAEELKNFILEQLKKAPNFDKIIPRKKVSHAFYRNYCRI